MQNKQATLIIAEISRALIPFLIFFSFYIQIFGEVGPGGGFQAGAILATCLICYDLCIRSSDKFMNNDTLLFLAAAGVLIYAATGMWSLLFGANYLNYDLLPVKAAQSLGIILVELGVGITVYSSLMVIYNEIKA